MCFSCEPYHCKYVTTIASQLVNHIAQHVRAASCNNYACFTCGIQFMCFDNLFNHIRESYTKVEYECVACGEFFSTKLEFDAHECPKTVNLDEIDITASEWREVEYIMEWNIEN